jgi:7-cyano-7-deazaguanine synthase
MVIQEHGEAWVLLSGGIDSATCVAFYLEHGFFVQSIFIDYGQIAAEREARAARILAQHYQVPHYQLTWSGMQRKSAGLVCGRNAFLLFAAMMEVPENATILAIGIHSGTSYPDCTPRFVNKMQALFDMYSDGTMQIGTPFLKWTKQDIWKFATSHGVPLNLTYSCERGLDQPCGKCLSCRDLEALDARSPNNP